MSIICQKKYAMEVGPYPRFYWTFDESSPGSDRVDKFISMPLIVEVNPGATPPGVDNSGKYSKAIDFDPSFVFPDSSYKRSVLSAPLNNAIGNTAFGYTAGQGFTVWCWIRANAINVIPGSESDIQLFNIVWQDPLSTPNLIQFFANLVTIDNSFADIQWGNVPFANNLPIALGVWHLVMFKFDPSTSRLSYRLDGGTFNNVITTPPLITVPSYGQGRFLIRALVTTIPFSGTGSFNWTVDEFGLFFTPLSDARADIIWSGGAGITWPAVASV